MDRISYLLYYLELIVAYGKYYLFYIMEVYRDFPAEMKVAAANISFIVLAILIMCLNLQYKFVIKMKKERTYKKLTQRYGKGIDYILSEETDSNLSRKEISEALGIDNESIQKKKLLKNKQEKRILCDLLYTKRIHHEVPRDKKENLSKILEIFTIPDFLENEASTGNNKQRIRAIIQIAIFRSYINPWVVNKLMNFRIVNIRRMAIYTSIISNSDTDLSYFGTSFFNKNCCVYDEIQLGYALQRRSERKLKLPNLANLVTQSDISPHVQCLFVRLMRKFNQKEYCDQLIDVFKSSHNSKLIEEIARTWGYLHFTPVEDLLKNNLLVFSDDAQVSILHAITRMNTGKSIDTLVEGFLSIQNPHVRFESLRCLYNYGQLGKAKLKELENTVPEADKKYFRFFYNPITKDKMAFDKDQIYRPSFEYF